MKGRSVHVFVTLNYASDISVVPIELTSLKCRSANRIQVCKSNIIDL